jgi:hypothetical protein
MSRVAAELDGDDARSVPGDGDPDQAVLYVAATVGELVRA